MKYNKSKVLVLLGWSCILIALLLISLRSQLMDFFERAVEQSYVAPAGKMFDLDNENFSFSVVSDTGAQNEPIDSILKEIKRSDAKFILHLGDLVRYRNDTHFDWMVSEIEDALIGFPFYMVPGNHEVISEGGDVDKSLYMEIFGQTHYWFGYGNTLFIGLDTSEGKLDNEQLGWLENTLNIIRPKFKYCVIFSHVPPINPEGKLSKTLQPGEAKKLAQAIAGKNITILLFGHTHDYTKTEFMGVPMYISPSSGQEIRSDIDKYGYMNITVSPDGIKNVNVNYVDKKAEVEEMEAFFSYAMVKKEIKIVAMWVMLFGFLLIAVARIVKNRH